jgi:hypothetical protein
MCRGGRRLISWSHVGMNFVAKRLKGGSGEERAGAAWGGETEDAGVDVDDADRSLLEEGVSHAMGEESPASRYRCYSSEEDIGRTGQGWGFRRDLPVFFCALVGGWLRPVVGAGCDGCAVCRCHSC